LAAERAMIEPMTYTLADASLLLDESTLRLTFSSNLTDPSQEPAVLFCAWLGNSRQVGFKFVDGGLATVFSFDHDQTRQRNYSEVPSRTDGVWTLILPREAAGDFTDGLWHAVLNVNGDDVSHVYRNLD
jgi:hypothetical protein